MQFSYLFVLAFVSSVLSQSALHPNGNLNKCLEVRGGVLANGTPVQIFDCNSTPAQQWTLNLGATSVRVANTNFCIDAGATPTNGTQMKIWECFANLPAQEWFLTSDDRVALLNQGLCLDLTNGDTTNTNVVQVWQCTDGDVNQIWTN
ncbi:carbohydrate-binding module family 13 protein [Macrolepiota fuliginosa MF-IS2]|uniref:Carbohydrate-binding module family 13 protein n=1 Tax=Macrolepiota fuliginosa MF-IS2 TaxID=1400762 RepID=A0A9P5XBH5_9AGAR|nr:carbohydrate-binding module family 13 protein [Macrolepiota fuliginosa MF-IS2]